MSPKRYPDDFKLEVVELVTVHGHAVIDVARRMGISTNSLYQWIKMNKQSPKVRHSRVPQAEELRRLKAELKRVTEERDILRMAAAYFAKKV